MFQFQYLKQLLIISVALSSVVCALIQKTKGLLRSSKYVILYSLVVNMVVGVLFCFTFTDIHFPNNLWVGFFSFLGADSIYKALEGKISSYSDIKNSKGILISEENIINKEEK